MQPAKADQYKKFPKLTATTGTIALTVINPAASLAIVYIGTVVVLNVTLNNQTGSDIVMQGNSNLEIYMPSYFTTAELQAMTIDTLSQAGWEFSVNASDGSLMLKWTSDTNDTWASGTNLTFNINNVLSSAAPDSDSVQVNFNNLAGSNIPSQDTVTLFLNSPVVPANVSLDSTLAVSSVNNGNVYVSASSDPLTNALYVNLKNTGTNPLYNGAAMWQGNPQVIVSFVYGNTSGALAPDDKSSAPAQGSAWNISASVNVDQAAGWTVQNPDIDGQKKSPQWILSPTNTNKQIIGTDADANVTFEFNDILSFTPPGATQMYLQFTGFTQDENTRYNDEIFIVNIEKENPPNPGAIGIWSTKNEVVVTSPSQTITVPFTWEMFGVASVNLSFTVPGMTIPDQSYTYGADHAALNYDTQNLTFSGLTSSQNLIVECSAYADSGRTVLLNKVQWTVPLSFPPQVTSFTGQIAGTTPGLQLQLSWTTEGATSVQGSWTNQELNANPTQAAVITPSLASPLKSVYSITATSPDGIVSAPTNVEISWGSVCGSIGVGTVPGAVAISPDGKHVFVANIEDLTVSVIDTSTLQQTAVVTVNNDPQSIAVSPDGRYVYVADFTGGTVSVIDTTQSPMTVTQTITITDGPYAIAVSPDGKTVCTANEQNTVSVIDTTQSPMAIVQSFPLENPTGLIFSRDGQRLFILSAGSN
ncbi:MAG TPA: YncE family protein, partial [Bacteroidia bacterium]|nr:YncE family protein [Bacteroidia bacterium]